MKIDYNMTNGHWEDSPFGPRKDKAKTKTNSKSREIPGLEPPC